MANITHDEVSIFFDDAGRGRPVVMLHGHTLDGRVFDEVVARLEPAKHRIIRPDLRGHGRSSRPDAGYHWSHHAADVRAVMAAAGLERALVLGFSIGGGVALELAVTSPELVSGLVLVSPVLPDRPFEPDFMANLKAVAKTARSEGIAEAMRGPWMESPLLATSFEKPGVKEKTEAIVVDFPGAEYLATSRDAVERNWKMPERLSKIAAPTVVMAGARDMPGFRAFADEIAAGIPGAKLDVVEDAGHLLPLEVPERVAAVVARMI